MNSSIGRRFRVSAPDKCLEAEMQVSEEEGRTGGVREDFR